MKYLFTILLSSLLILPIFYVWAEYNAEMKQAYNWAYANQITTMDSIERANMNWNLKRGELAKMISNYTTEVLWKEIDTTKTCRFSDVSEELDSKYYYWITHACQLWLMWQGISDFRPNDEVTRAEFWTILSRALWWSKNEWGTTYYQNHLKALKAEWIMTNISYPMNKEIRWYVMIMLMRSTNNESNNYTIDQQPSDTDDQISYVIKMLD
jgi:succinate dehydrogenase flavin-adding protein (antitoxin of CptAB toxin-antitoxin module)